MKNFLRENWSRLAFLTVLILFAVNAFYWYELRPAEIKKECSWVEKQTAAIPEVTQADIDQAKIDAPTKTKTTEAWEPILSLAEWKITKLAAENPHPAIPPKTYIVAADPAQYSFCLHSHGL